MEVPIFSPKGYIAYTGKVFGTEFPLHGSTKDYSEAVMADLSHETAQSNREKNSSRVIYGNDAILMDSYLLKQIQPSTSGFVTVKLVNDTLDKNVQERGRSSGRTVSPIISNRNSTVGGRGNSISGFMVSTFQGSAAEPVVVPSTSSSSSSSARIPMTPIITCRLARKNLSRSLSPHISNTSDASSTTFVQYFKEAVVVPLQTMRFLGAEEGSMIRFEFHDERVVSPASSVVFSLTSQSVGDEGSFDTYLRHFIAPFFLQQIRAVSLDEEFEFKNHDRGDLHITVVSINDGYARCALITDTTHIHLVIQPEAPPNLQGQRNLSVPRSVSHERRSSSAYKNNSNNNSMNRHNNQNRNHNNNNSNSIIPLRDSTHTRNTTQRDGEVSPRPTIPASVQETTHRRASIGAEPHSAAALSAYAPQSVDKGQVIVVEKREPPMRRPIPEKDLERERIADNRNTANNTPVILIGTSQTVADAGTLPVMLTKKENYQMKRIPVEGPKDHNTPRTPEQVQIKEDSSNVPDSEEKASCRDKEDSLVHVLRTPAEMEDILLQQNSEKLSHNLATTNSDAVMNATTSTNTTTTTVIVTPHDKQKEDINFGMHVSMDDKMKKTESLRSNSHPSSEIVWLCHLTGQVRSSSSSSSSNHYPKNLQDKLNVSLPQDTESEDNRLMKLQEKSDSPNEKYYYVDTPKSSLHPFPEENVDVMQQEEENPYHSSPHASTTEVFEEAHDQGGSEKIPLGQCNAWTQYEVPDEEISHHEDQNRFTPHTDNDTKSIISSVKEDQRERTQKPRDSLSEHEAVKTVDNISSYNASELPTMQQPNEGIKTTKDPDRNLLEKANKVVQEWLSVKKEWESLPISPLLKREPYIIIKMFQYFVAIYKELKQRHADCIAFLDSPYGHTLRGGMVVRISLLVVSDDDGGNQDPFWGPKKIHYYSDINTSTEKNDDISAYESNSEASSVTKASDLLKVSLNDLSTALGCEVLHVFRVGGTCPTLYCTLVKPYTDGPDEIVLLGESCPVEVLHTTILEDLCRVREESRSEWMDLSIQWTEAISSVLRLGIFAKHLQTVRELFWELAFLLRHPGEVRHSSKYQRSVSQQNPTQSFNSGNSEVHDNSNHERENVNTESGQSRSESVDGNKVNTFTEYEEFIPYLQELQDTYYLYSELLEPFALQSLHQLDMVAAATDVSQCEELMRFLQVSYQAQEVEENMQEEGEGPFLSSLSLSPGVEEERSAFNGLIKARKAGAIMPLPREWWESSNTTNKKKSHSV
ncbi:uncharacterized protein TM35_000202000 [Trypanosoma theileri]|uniref:Uncharacterized protein n=1 Tax=Trypanosoma theileri TaxID=67003 RepID=A0A1X0NT72_9TRYP|nr:uncharacterized protein TM35_000202000 [Trypanosoma theileri]ORC87791.1 hypothetical protein TM35_000202000 [Trypanosoma theileri]